MAKEKLPHFLGIGAQKSATRWLYNQLKRHPEVYLTPVKELHYFDRIRKTDVYSERFHLDVWKKNFFKFTSRAFGDLDWKLNYYFGKYSDEWYSSLFNMAKGRKSGEITPEYSILKKDDIERIKDINPEMRIIYQLRDPVSRAWSHFRMHVRRSGLRYDHMSETEVFKFIGSTNCFIKGDYSNNLKRWYSVFDEEKIFTGYLEEVKENPEGLLRNVLSHIGVNVDSTHFQGTMEEPSHVGQAIPIELKYHEFLREKYFHHNEELYKLLGNPIIKAWNSNKMVL